MINTNKNQVAKLLARKIAPKIFSLFQTFFFSFFFKANKKIGVGRFLKNLPPQFSLFAYISIGAGGDMNLNNYLAWPN